jgi:hypothetical protein
MATMSAPKYRRRHQQLRARLLAALTPGTPCPQIVNGRMCGKPMYPTQNLDLGHNDDGTYLGLVHSRCNRQAGAINSNRGAITRTLAAITSSGRRW